MSKIDISIPPIPNSSADDYIENPSYDPAKPFGVDGNFPDMANPNSEMAKWWAVYPELILLEKDFNDNVPKKDLMPYQITKTDAFYEALRLIGKHSVAPPAWLAEELQNNPNNWPQQDRANPRAHGRLVFIRGKILRELYLEWKTHEKGKFQNNIGNFIKQNFNKLAKIGIGSKTPFDIATNFYKNEDNQKEVAEAKTNQLIDRAP